MKTESNQLNEHKIKVFFFFWKKISMNRRKRIIGESFILKEENTMVYCKYDTLTHLRDTLFR